MNAAADSVCPFLLDVDTGIDDALALIYACSSPEMELVGVSCVGGNVDARQVSTNTLAVLELCGRGDVEVALGRDRPLARALRTTPETHGPRGLGYAELPAPGGSLSPRAGPELLIESARRRPEEVTLVTLGPLTNLAVAVLREPDLPRLLRGLVMMAGSYRSPGNTAPTTEWNIAVDPEAAAVVLDAFGRDAPRRPVALGLDVTERARLTPDHLARVAGSAPGAPLVRFVDDALRFYMEFHSRYDGFYGAYLHDPLALAAALHPSLIWTQAVAVEIELGGRLTTGETVTDWRRTWGRPANLDVAVGADSDRFLSLLVDRLADLARLRTGTRPSDAVVAS